MSDGMIEALIGVCGAVLGAILGAIITKRKIGTIGTLQPYYFPPQDRSRIESNSPMLITIHMWEHLYNCKDNRHNVFSDVSEAVQRLEVTYHFAKIMPRSKCPYCKGKYTGMVKYPFPAYVVEEMIQYVCSLTEVGAKHPVIKLNTDDKFSFIAYISREITDQYSMDAVRQWTAKVLRQNGWDVDFDENWQK